MNTEAFVQLLNQDLSLEYQSIIQYTQHIATVSGPEFQSIGDELKIHVGQEVTHATVLAAQIAFLGGVPTTEVPAIGAAEDTRGALAMDLELETGQLERYRERTMQATEVGLPDVAEALRPLLQQTQEHVRDLQAALGL